jgi:hypothetical protein
VSTGLMQFLMVFEETYSKMFGKKAISIEQPQNLYLIFFKQRWQKLLKTISQHSESPYLSRPQKTYLQSLVSLSLFFGHRMHVLPEAGPESRIPPEAGSGCREEHGGIGKTCTQP